MTCERITFAGGGTAIVCGTRRRKRCACGRPATLLCDWKVPGGTCDADLCSRCTTSPAPDKDLCRTHRATLAEWKSGRRILRRAADYITQARKEKVLPVEVLHQLRSAFGATTWVTGHMMVVSSFYLRVGDVLAMSDIDEQTMLTEWTVKAVSYLKMQERRA